MNRTELIQSLNLEGVGLELGVFQGNFSHTLLNNTKLYMYLIDSWRYFEVGYKDIRNQQDEIHNLNMATVVSRLRKFENRYTLIRDLSVNANKIFANEFFDFIYIDANHSYISAKKDIEAWYPKLKIGGIFAGHDYLDKPPQFEVKKAVDEFAQNNNLTIYTTTSDIPYLTWYINKV
jgi:SAM-dependent MidA family methyltransferase